MNVSNDGVFHFLATYLKSPKLIFRVGPNYLLVPNKSSKTCIQYGRAKCLQFGPAALGNEFDPAVGQVANIAGDFETGGHGLGRVTEANTLHAPGIEDGQAAAAGVVRRRHGRDEAKARRAMQCFLTVDVKVFAFWFDRMKDLP
jgi:hypothetical protein